MDFQCIKKKLAAVLGLVIVTNLAMIPAIASTTPETVVDDTAPYSGEILVGINTDYSAAKISDADTWNALLSNTQSTGEVSFSEMLSLPDASMEWAGGVEASAGIMGYDDNGVGIIDPNSFLPDLTDGDLAGIPATVDSGVATMSATETKSLLAYAAASYGMSTFELVYEGEYCKIWNLQGGDERFVLTEEQAQVMAEKYDSNLYAQVIDYFGDPLDLDKSCNNDGKTDFYCYDIYGDADTNGGAYAAGFFWSTNTSPSYGGTDGVHIDTAQGMGHTIGMVNYVPDYTKCLDTLVHELQHLVCYGILGSTTNYPTFLNEAFSESSTHLIMGAEASQSRIEYFNTLNTLNSYTAYLNQGRVALMLWNSYYYTIPNYAYSYLFGQYIRSQSSSSIYKEYLNAVKSVDTGYSQEDYVTYLADMLGFEDIDDMITSFYIALANPTGSGVHSFNDLDFAITPTVSVMTEGQDVISGGVVYYNQTGDFTPDGAGSDMVFYSVSQDMELEQVTLNVDDSAKTEYLVGDELDVTGLTLTVDYSNGAQETITVTADMISGFESSKVKEALTLTVSYAGFSDTFNVAIEALEYGVQHIQVGTEQANEYVGGRQLLLAFTNDETAAFNYDGTPMYDVSANGYAAEDDLYYEYAFACVVEGSGDEDLVEEVERTSSHSVLACTENVNGSASTDLRDAIAVVAVYMDNETYFDGHMSIVLQCDVNADGVVDMDDCKAIFAAYLK